MSGILPRPWPQSRARGAHPSASGKRIAGKSETSSHPAGAPSAVDLIRFEMSNDEPEPRGPWEFSPDLKKPLIFYIPSDIYLVRLHL